MEPTTTRARVTRIDAEGRRQPLDRPLAVELPVAVEINGLAYAVMMLTPDRLEDFACGFLLAEQLIRGPGDILDIDTHRTPEGILLRVTLVAAVGRDLRHRMRHRTGDSACGLCGVESLEAALPPLPRLPAAAPVAEAALFRALAALADAQPLNRLTGAVHAAAACAADGALRLVREDVGRHNAFDKLIGALLRAGMGWEGGFALLSSRCSVELVEKAVLAGCPLLVTVSAPTALAASRAAAAGLGLVVLARPDALLRLEPEASGPPAA